MLHPVGANLRVRPMQSVRLIENGWMGSPSQALGYYRNLNYP